MTKQTDGWQAPLTAWQVIEKRYFVEKPFDAATFSDKYNLPLATVRKIASGEMTDYSQDFYAALSCETGLGEQMLRNLCAQDQRTA